MIDYRGMSPTRLHVQSGPSVRYDRHARIWIAALVSAICFEGLGRKLGLPVPEVAFYFLKDVILIFGLLLFGITPVARDLYSRLFGPLLVVIWAAMLYTLVWVAHPESPSYVLGVIGWRAYWLWWMAPLVIASVIRSGKVLEHARVTFALTAIAVSLFAALQFSAPASSFLNAYATYEGQTLVETALVGSTGRARVSSTFAYITGFADFTILAPPLLLGLSLSAETKRKYWLYLAAAGATCATLPMTGSRGPVVLVGVAFAVVLWRAGSLRTKAGRRLVFGGLLILLTAWFSSPTAISGVRSRFGYDDTGGRFAQVLNLLPPFAIQNNDGSWFGDGTGTQQNARIAFGFTTTFDVEEEPGRLIAELGFVGYCVYWLARVALAVALLRLAKLLRVKGRLPAEGVAIAYAIFSFVGLLAFDHIWQSLLFLGAGLLFAEYINVLRLEHALRTAPNPS